VNRKMVCLAFNHVYNGHSMFKGQNIPVMCTGGPLSESLYHRVFSLLMPLYTHPGSFVMHLPVPGNPSVSLCPISLSLYSYISIFPPSSALLYFDSCTYFHICLYMWPYLLYNPLHHAFSPTSFVYIISLSPSISLSFSLPISLQLFNYMFMIFVFMFYCVFYVLDSY